MTALERKFYRPDEVAKLLKISTRTVRHWAQHGRIPFLKINGVLRLPAQEIDDLVKRLGK